MFTNNYNNREDIMMVWNCTIPYEKLSLEGKIIYCLRWNNEKPLHLEFSDVYYFYLKRVLRNKLFNELYASYGYKNNNLSYIEPSKLKDFVKIENSIIIFPSKS